MNDTTHNEGGAARTPAGFPVPRVGSEAWQQGEAAFYGDVNPWENPHEFGTQEHEDWRAAYHRAMVAFLNRMCGFESDHPVKDQSA